MNACATSTAISIIGLLTFALPAQVRADDCAAALGAFRVDFPERAQEQRRHGVVHVAVRLGVDGRVESAQVAKSSGHADLDRAAENSARKFWRFTVAQCSPADLTLSRVIAVTYRRSPGLSVSGTLNRRARAHIRQLHRDPDCHAVQRAQDSEVFACRETSAFDVADAR